MEKTEYTNIFSNEANHFYYESLRELVFGLAKPVARVKNIKILDAGTGTGLMAQKLEALGEVTTTDINPESIRLSRLRGLKTIKTGVEKMPFKNNQFDLVTCIDVLVSVDSDMVALKEIFRVTKSGGKLILRVSAHEWLRTDHDKVVHIRRRYTKEEVREKMMSAGWQIERLSYMNLVLVIPLWIKSMKQRQAKAVSNISRVPGWVNMCLTWLLRIENGWLGRFDLPFGIGIVAVGSKP